jgi:hypothetical protein
LFSSLITDSLCRLCAGALTLEDFSANTRAKNRRRF